MSIAPAAPRAVFHELMPKLHGSALTITGKTLAENYADAQVYDHEVIRSLDNPVSESGALYVLYGNLAPEGGIIKAGAVKDSMRKFSGPAKTYDSLDDSAGGLGSQRDPPR